MNARQSTLLITILVLLLGGTGYVLFGSSGADAAPDAPSVRSTEDIEQRVTDGRAREGASTTRSDAVIDSSSMEGDDVGGGELESMLERTAVALSGRVVDLAGAPVANAEVLAYARVDPRALFESAGQRRGGVDFRNLDFRSLMQQKPLAEAVRTARDGSFALDATVARQSNVQLRVSHQSFAPSVVDRGFDADQDGAELHVDDVILGGGVTVVGRVVDERGNAVPNALVRVEPNGGGMMGGRGRRGGGRGGFQMPGGGSELAELIGEGRTDGLGNFSVARVPAGSFRVRAEAAAQLPADSGNQEGGHGDTVDVGALQLGPGAVLSGIVVDAAGEPVADARVVATVSRDAMGQRMRAQREAAGNSGDEAQAARDAMRQQMGMLWRARQETRTDKEGRFQLDQVPQQDVRLEVSHPDHVDHTEEPVQPLATPQLRIQLGELLTVAGVVIDSATGAPVENFGITARRVRGDAGGPGGGRGAGRAIAAPDDPEAAQRIAEREARMAEMEAQRDREEAFRQQLLGGTGMIPGRTPDPTPHADGRFELADLQPGDYVLDVDAPDYVKVAAVRVTLEPGQPAPDLRIAIERGVRIRGLLLDAGSGEPVVGARVSLRVPQLDGGDAAAGEFLAMMGGGRGGPGGAMRMFGGGRGMALQAVRSDAAGEFEFEPQRSGRYVLAVEAENYPDYSDEDFVLPQAGGTHSVKIRLDPGGTVFGSVFGLEEGERARVVFVHADSNDRATTDVDRDTNEYRIAGLLRGGYRVSVEVRSDGERNDWRQRIGQALAASMSGAEPDVYITGSGEQRHDIGADALELPSVRGLVFRNGAPGAGLEVRLSVVEQPGAPTDPASRMLSRMARLLSDRVDGETGEFVIEGVPAGTYRLEVATAGGGRGGRGGGPRLQIGGGNEPLHSEVVVVVKGRDTERTVDVQTGAATLRLIDAENQPVTDGGQLELVLSQEAAGMEPNAWRDLPSFRRSRIRNGTLELAEAPVGSWSYRLRVNGYQELTGELVVTPGGKLEQELQLQKTQ